MSQRAQRRGWEEKVKGKRGKFEGKKELRMSAVRQELDELREAGKG